MARFKVFKLRPFISRALLAIAAACLALWTVSRALHTDLFLGTEGSLQIGTVNGSAVVGQLTHHHSIAANGGWDWSGECRWSFRFLSDGFWFVMVPWWLVMLPFVLGIAFLERQRFQRWLIAKCHLCSCGGSRKKTPWTHRCVECGGRTLAMSVLHLTKVPYVPKYRRGLKPAKWSGFALCMTILAVMRVSMDHDIRWSFPNMTNKMAIVSVGARYGCLVVHRWACTNSSGFACWYDVGDHMGTSDIRWNGHIYYTGDAIAEIHFPLWAPLVLLTLVTARLWQIDAYRRWRGRVTRCVSCSYELRGLRRYSLCPECGVGKRTRYWSVARRAA